MIQDCTLCGSAAAHAGLGKTRDRESVEAFRCGSCNSIFLSDLSHVTEELYEKGGMHEVSVELSNRRWVEWRKETEKGDLRRALRVKSLLRPGGSVLDFGCGNGGFVEFLKKEDKTLIVQGLEIEADARERLRAEGKECFRDLREVPPGSYDCITLFHVLEHIAEPTSLLAKIRTRLKGDGLVVIEVPHADDALISLYQSQAFLRHTLWSLHAHLFSKASLLRVMDEAGFEVQFMGGIQRYGLANHLYWLAFGGPGGHQHWGQLESSEAAGEYAKWLIARGLSDTLWCVGRSLD